MVAILSRGDELNIDLDLDNDLFTINTIRYISMACNKEYFMVCGERIPQCFIELQINKTVNTFNKHSFNIYILQYS